MINAHDISSDDDYPVQKHSPAIAPMRFDSVKSQPLKRRFYSTGAKKPEQLQQPLEKIDNEDLNSMVFAMKKGEFVSNQESTFSEYKGTSPMFQKQSSTQALPKKVTIVEDISNSNALANQQQRRLVRSRKPSISQTPLAAIKNDYLSTEDLHTPTENRTISVLQTKQVSNSTNNVFTKNAQKEVEEPVNLTKTKTFNRSRSNQINTNIKDTELEASFKYNEIKSKGNFQQFQPIYDPELAKQTQNQIKQQFIKDQRASPQRKMFDSPDPTIKQYSAQTLMDLFSNLESKNDWAVRDRALKEIQNIALLQPHVLKDFGPLFLQVPKILIDLRTALVTQALDTLKQVYKTYSNTDFLNQQQQYVVHLFKKAGNPALADFMAQSTDITIVHAVSNLISSTSFQQTKIDLFLQNITNEVRATNQPGLKYRVFYLLGDLLSIAYYNLIPQIAAEVLERYDLEYTQMGIQTSNQFFTLENSIGCDLVQQKLKRSLTASVAFCSDQVRKLQTDANPEVRRSIRRLYAIMKGTGLMTESIQKIDDFLKREGVVDTWFGR
ncbi:Conserved_hypothetical protein [Hexamita inflata]|uniref:TOG domain-containing protein n=1 Tax=Hexamita inflata TaxID=28002 RepID=A0AA86PJM6_9EUKA|nr:Conserved hypothetical protein [Hexamita inflata]